ncbi:uncharacterized protein LOC117110175 [Anneissia japonica]|uniref:uncharacterized protein LOC117110175 n=1 Tax=Anneissia japonica TaxID=1529436 RepID=UPI0014259A08|nr:uncharacterized protein LOC117110175 [Anneissia japonica]
MNTVRNKVGCPWVFRSDHGTENSVVGQLQQFLRRANQDPVASFVQGTSQHNQRIECWWSMLRRHCTQYWMELFSQLKEDARFDGGLLDKSLVQFCFLNLIQDEFNTVLREWNAHCIAPSRNRDGPFGRPVVMYTSPELYGGQQFIVPLQRDEIEICETECIFKSQYTCDKDVFNLCSILMRERQLSQPNNPEESLYLYVLRIAITELL